MEINCFIEKKLARFKKDTSWGIKGTYCLISANCNTIVIGTGKDITDIALILGVYSDSEWKIMPWNELNWISRSNVSIFEEGSAAHTLFSEEV